MKKDDPPELTSTQRLPVLGKVLVRGPEGVLVPVPPLRVGTGGRESIVCRRCRRRLFLPETLAPGHIRCNFCGEIHRVGIPLEYERIVCSCGKILTALKKFAGKPGRCRTCGRIHIVGGASSPMIKHPGPILMKTQRLPTLNNVCEAPKAPQEDQGVPVARLIRFKCSCGQPHMVEGDRSSTTILCFRCNREIQVPDLETHCTEAESKLPQLSSEESDWCLHTPYPTEDLFAAFSASPAMDISELKQACRTVQSQISRDDPAFQRAQLAKDTLTKAESRLYYELLGEDLRHLWQGIAKNKWLSLHDQAILIHKQAIAMEKRRLYLKADRLWQRSISCWLKLISSTAFPSAIAERGGRLFGPKFKAELPAQLCRKLADEVLIHVGCQFRERYLAEDNTARADIHLQHLRPLLEYRWDSDPADVRNRELLGSSLVAEIKSLVEKGRWKKLVPLISRLKSLASGNADLLAFIEETLALAGNGLQ